MKILVTGGAEWRIIPEFTGNQIFGAASIKTISAGSEFGRTSETSG